MIIYRYFPFFFLKKNPFKCQSMHLWSLKYRVGEWEWRYTTNKTKKVLSVYNKTSNLKGVSLADHEFIISQLVDDTALYVLCEVYSIVVTVEMCWTVHDVHLSHTMDLLYLQTHAVAFWCRWNAVCPSVVAVSSWYAGERSIQCSRQDGCQPSKTRASARIKRYCGV